MAWIFKIFIILKLINEKNCYKLNLINIIIIKKVLINKRYFLYIYSFIVESDKKILNCFMKIFKSKINVYPHF